MAAFHHFDSASFMIMSNDVQHRSLPYIHIHFFEAGMMRDYNIPISVHATFIESEFLEQSIPSLPYATLMMTLTFSLIV